MKNIRQIDIRSEHEGSDEAWLMLTNNVSYLYSKFAIELKLSGMGVRRINVRFCDHLVNRESIVFDGVVDVFCVVDFGLINIDDEMGSQRYILYSLHEAILGISQLFDIDKIKCGDILKMVLDTNFSINVPLCKWLKVDDFRRARVFMMTGFDHTKIFLEIKHKKSYKDIFIFCMWSSPILPVLNFRGINVFDNKIALSMYKPNFSIGVKKFNICFYDFSASKAQPVIEDQDNGLLLFKYDLLKMEC